MLRDSLKIGPVILSCPCGKPLQLAKMKDGAWVLGDLDSMCSPLIRSLDANALLEKFLELLVKVDVVGSDKKNWVTAWQATCRDEYERKP